MPTTTTTNTNTTPLSAMTGEEVASILVGLIRQNDGVLIQQKVTDGINQSLGPLANDVTDGRSALVTKMRAVGIDIPTNATYQQIYDKFNEMLILAMSGTKLYDGVSISTLGDLICMYENNSNVVENIRSNVTALYDNFMVNNTNVKRLELPECISLSYGSPLISPLYNAKGLIYLYMPKLSTLPNTGSVFNYRPMINMINLKCLSATNLSTWYQGIYGAYALMHFYSKNCPMNTSGNESWSGCSNLYDVTYSIIINLSHNVSYWRPSTALSSASQSLCDHDEWDDPNEPQGGFANNLQKFLWYFEYHFIPCFGDVSSLPLADRPVLTLYTTVESAINSAMSKSQPTKTLKQLLVDDKGWQVLASN